MMNDCVQLRSLHERTEIDGYYPSGTNEHTKQDIQNYRCCISIAFLISGGVVSTTPHHATHKPNTTFRCKLHPSNQYFDVNHIIISLPLPDCIASNVEH